MTEKVNILTETADEIISNSKPNSHKYRKESSNSDERRVKKVISGGVSVKERSIGKKFSDTFLDSDNLKSVKSYILFDILIPAFKNALWNIISGGSEMIIFGRGGGARKGESKRYTPYDKPSYSNSKSSLKRETRPLSFHDFSEIVFESRNDAMDVLESMYDLILDYGWASVADLYELSGITGNFTDNKYGWINLDNVDVKMARGGGYYLDLPKAELLS